MGFALNAPNNIIILVPMTARKLSLAFLPSTIVPEHKSTTQLACMLLRVTLLLTGEGRWEGGGVPILSFSSRRDLQSFLVQKQDDLGISLSFSISSSASSCGAALDCSRTRQMTLCIKGPIRINGVPTPAVDQYFA